MRLQLVGDDRVLASAVAAEVERRHHTLVDDSPEAVIVTPRGGRRELGALMRLLVPATGPPLVLASRVGCDLVPLPSYRARLQLEERVASTRRGWTVWRFTHHHEEVWDRLARLARPPVMVVANDTRLQPLDPHRAAAVLAEAAEAEPRGHAGDLGGPHAYELRDLAHSYLAASGRRRPVLSVNAPGIAGAALRAGAALTSQRDDQGRTWNDFVAIRLSGPARPADEPDRRDGPSPGPGDPAP